MADAKSTGRIVSIERLNCSVNGNPRFRITLQRPMGLFTWKTMSDCAFNYEIGNPGYRVDDTVTLTIGRNSRGNTITAIDTNVKDDGV